jgi:hypothetical protein
MCSLLRDLTHFNFRTNIMSTLVARLSRRTWDEVGDSHKFGLTLTILNSLANYAWKPSFTYSRTI